MVQVIATIELKPGCRDAFLPILNENVPKVKDEDGCLAREHLTALWPTFK